MILLITGYGVYHTHGQSSIQCGECTCIRIDPYYIMDCEKLGLKDMPAVDSFTQRFILRAYMSGNMIKSLTTEYFDKWYSLKYIDFSENPDLHCEQTLNIPDRVQVQTECENKTQCKYKLRICYIKSRACMISYDTECIRNI